MSALQGEKVAQRGTRSCSNGTGATSSPKPKVNNDCPGSAGLGNASFNINMSHRPRKCPCSRLFKISEYAIFIWSLKKNFRFSLILKLWKAGYRDIFLADGSYSNWHALMSVISFFWVCVSSVFKSSCDLSGLYQIRPTCELPRLRHEFLISQLWSFQGELFCWSANQCKDTHAHTLCRIPCCLLGKNTLKCALKCL